MPAIDGLEAFLDGQAHRRLAVASSSERAWLDTMLGRLGLAGFFGEHVYSAARIPRGKPHPDVYLHVDEQLRLPSSACLVIEDPPVGAAAGAAAGMTVIGLMAATHIRSGPDERPQAAGGPPIAPHHAKVAD